MSGLGLGHVLVVVAVTTVAVVAAVAAPLRPAPRRVGGSRLLRPDHDGHNEPGMSLLDRAERLAACPAVVPAGRGPPGATPTVRRATVAVVGVLAGLAFGPPAVLAVAVLTVAAPRWRRRRDKRLRVAAVESELPEVVDLLALAVGAGLTVTQAVTAAARHGLGPLSAALATVVADVAHGRRLADALDELPRRAGEPARPLAATLAACERYGAPVAEGLDRLALEARDRQRRRAEQAARRLPVLLLFPLVLCILPAFALLAIVPLIADAIPALRL